MRSAHTMILCLGMVLALASAPLSHAAPTGDCNGDSQVSIAEVQSAINMFLGINQIQSCVDRDTDGTVSIAEVQKTINAFLQIFVAGDTYAVTGQANAVSSSTATLNGTFSNPEGYTTTAWFEYGLTSAYGMATGHEAYAAVGQIPMTAPVFGLQQLATYHFRLVTQNSAGTFYGQDRTFMTIALQDVLAADLNAPVGLASDGTYAYWFEIYSGRLRRVNLSTGEINTLVTVTTTGNSGDIGLDAHYIYFAVAGTVMRIDRDGSNLNNRFALVGNISRIVPHSTGIYVRRSKDWYVNGEWTKRYYLSRVSLDGTDIVDIYERPQVSSEGFGGDIIIDDSYLYWSDYFKGTIHRMPLSGGAPVTLALGLNHPDDLLLDEATLYVAADDGIKKLPVAGGVVTNVYATAACRMAIDGVSMYLAVSGQGNDSLVKLDLATGSTSLLAASENYLGSGGYSAPVVTIDRLYWLVGGNSYYPPLGKLVRIPKP